MRNIARVTPDERDESGEMSETGEPRAEIGEPRAEIGKLRAEIDRLLAAAPAAQGYLAVTTERGDRTYLLGPRTQVDGAAVMLDWRSAPLAEAFFRYRPGEPYEIEAGEKTAAGRVVARWVIAKHGEALVGEDRVIGQGQDALRIPGALWGDRPGEAWYVLESVARFRAREIGRASCRERVSIAV